VIAGNTGIRYALPAPPSEMQFEDGETMQFEDGETMEFE
jgi:hypothetical protein